MTQSKIQKDKKFIEDINRRVTAQQAGDDEEQEDQLNQSRFNYLSTVDENETQAKKEVSSIKLTVPADLINLIPNSEGKKLTLNEQAIGSLDKSQSAAQLHDRQQVDENLHVDAFGKVCSCNDHSQHSPKATEYIEFGDYIAQYANLAKSGSNPNLRQSPPRVPSQLLKN